MHERSGLRVAAEREVVEVGDVVTMQRRVGPVVVRASCRVVYVIDEPSRRGFAYGTLAGHPESGEEAFVVEMAADGPVTATVTAFSRPASTTARLAGPIGRRIQASQTQRYLDALTV